MDRLKKIMVVFWTAIANFCTAQTFTTPEVFSFKQEVFRPVSYYTGQANVSIPLTQVQTPEITIPVTLNYTGGGGLRPVNPYSSAGMGWKISAGGAITRTRNGVCDENLIAANGGTLNGFFNLPANTVTNNNVRSNLSTYVSTAANGTQYFSPLTEYSPDVFSFSFLGYSGYFLLGYDGTFKIQSQDIVSIEKIGSIAWPAWPGVGTNVGFRLTANDGTKFTFGTTGGSMELSGGNGPGIPYQAEAWYLTKVESMNGRVISFNYQTNASTFVRFKPSTETTVNSAVCPVVLDNITFNGGRVVFTSSTVTQQIGDVPSSPLMINKIELQNTANQVISKTTFSYSPENSQRYYFLDSVISDGKKYAFGYYNRAGLPGLAASLGADYWGFYNGSSEVTSIGVTNVASFWDSYLNPTITYPARMPSVDYAKRGVLTSITYPTGGVETYDYEANTYSYLGVERPTGTGYTYSEEPKIAGGLRIAQITLGNMVRKYRYVNSFDPNNPTYIPGSMSYIGFSSSGYLYRLPGVPYFGYSVSNALSIDGEPPVVYGKVIEFLSDKSYTEYTMRSPLDLPDGDNNQSSSYYSVGASNTGIFSHYAQAAFAGSLGKHSSHSLERGQVSAMKVYDGTNTLKKSTVYTYATDPNRYSQNVAAVNIVSTADPVMAQLGLELGLAYFPAGIYFSVIHSFEIYTFPVYLEQEVETSYEAGNTLQRTTQYKYNAQKLRSATITTNSHGDTLKTLVRYPADMSTGVYVSMVTNKMLNYPVEQVQLENNTVTGSKLTTFKANGSTYVPDKKYALEITFPVLTPGFFYFDGTSKDGHYGTTPEISYDNYSTYGNVRQTTTKDGIVTAYLWDASDIYPMAQVKGGAYSLISAQDGKAADYSSSTLYTSLSSLAPGAFISTYSYKPLVGMTGATDVRGRNTYYNYDQYSRLVLIRDHDKNILKKYCYNYQGQAESCQYYGNQLYSYTYKRNNCTGCQIGSSVTYTVPANTYFASTQTDANTLAQNDVTANAQNYANANGTCGAAVLASLVSSNTITSKSFTAVFHNNCTSTNYTYTLNANTSNVTLSPQLPTGNYNVTITPVGGGTTSYGYWVNAFSQYGTTGNILGVDIVTGSNQIRITP